MSSKKSLVEQALEAAAKDPRIDKYRLALRDLAKELRDPSDPDTKALLAPVNGPEAYLARLEVMERVEKKANAPLTVYERWLLHPTWRLPDGGVIELAADGTLNAVGVGKADRQNDPAFTLPTTSANEAKLHGRRPSRMKRYDQETLQIAAVLRKKGKSFSEVFRDLDKMKRRLPSDLDWSQSGTFIRAARASTAVKKWFSSNIKKLGPLPQLLP